MEAALKCNAQNAEMAKKARELKKVINSSKPNAKKDKENQEKNKSVNGNSGIEMKTQGNKQVSQ